jgi:hypothetical protein
MNLHIRKKMKHDSVSLQEYFQAMMDEREKGVFERFRQSELAVKEALASADKQVAAALASQDKSTLTAFVASEKAIVKAEMAQSLFNQASIDVNNKLDDQAKQFITRIESLSTTKALEEKAETLRLLFDSKMEAMREATQKDVEDTESDIAELRANLAASITRGEHESALVRVGQLEQYQASTISRAEVQQQFDTVASNLDTQALRDSAIEAQISKLEGRMIAGGTGVAVFSIIVAIGLHFIK